ncbi:HesA/MoeB/ThiF family protein [Candidatus Woesearchaeota archaeon]|nr:MAG: HesA/MoeB/ThiF family protein [Candidatus Woesearchaeota archaeon]
MRYARQEMLAEIGKEGQNQLRKKTVCIVGVGALGSVSAELLCRAGIGKLILIDHDAVDITNLQRQSLYDDADVGKLKIDAAEKKLEAINKDVAIEKIKTFLSAETIKTLPRCDILLDCTDNFPTRFLINDYCLKNKLPWIYASAVGVSGMICVIHQDACFNCIFENKISYDDCESYGVLNTVTFAVSALQVTQALKLLLKKDYEKSLLVVNAWNATIEKIKVQKRKNCSACDGNYQYLHHKKKYVMGFCKSKNSYFVELHEPVDVKAFLKRNPKVIKELGSMQLLKLDNTTFLLHDDGRMGFYVKDKENIEAILKIFK